MISFSKGLRLYYPHVCGLGPTLERSIGTKPSATTAGDAGSSANVGAQLTNFGSATSECASLPWFCHSVKFSLNFCASVKLKSFCPGGAPSIGERPIYWKSRDSEG